MTTSERIRAAALGPTPRRPTLRKSWLKLMSDEWWHVSVMLVDGNTVCGSADRWRALSDSERRMFLLFVAEAVE